MWVGLGVEQALAPVPGGTGRYSTELGAALARTAGDGDAVLGWTAWHRDVKPAKVPGVGDTRRLPLPRRPLIAAWELGIGPAPRRADVIHAPTLLFPPRRRRPLVVTIHDTVPWTHPEMLTPRGVRWHRAMADRAARHADAIVVPTASVAEELVAVLRTSGDRLRVLGGGVARSLLQPPADADEVARQLRLPDRYLLSLATLEPRKGLDVLIEALSRLGDAAPHLVVVGQPGWGGVDLPPEAGRAGLPADRLHVLGWLGDSALGVVLRRATVLVAPSRAEGFGLPVAEAMAVGTPVICSDAPALVEVAGDAAVVVPRGDAAALAAAIQGLLADEPQRARLSAAGLTRASRYDWDEVARRAWRLYHELAG